MSHARRFAGAVAFGAVTACAAVTGLDGYAIVDAQVDSGSSVATAEAGQPEAAPTIDSAPPPTSVDAADAPSTIACSDAEVAFAAGCYSFLKGLLDQRAAKAACSVGDAHLATLGSADENAAFAQLLDGGTAWIGLESPGLSQNDAAAFGWVNGEPVTFLGFPPGEPNDNHRCVVHGSGPVTGVGWHTRLCSDTYPAICERP